MSSHWRSLLTAFLFLPLAIAGTISGHARTLLLRSMSYMDELYDPRAEYLHKPDTALLHETRSSSWYAVGLLARNENDDKEQAVKVISNIISLQYHNASEQWYGDYGVYPESPYPGTEQYEAIIYKSWDPNWRGFVGTTFVIVLEEYGHLLSETFQERMIESLHVNAIGDTYRVGGWDDDNLYPAYSNAAIMKAAVSGWVGRRTGDANLTADGEIWGREIVELFDRNGSLFEFNSPTYTGVSLLGLALWANYLPADSVLGANGPRMIRRTWDEVGELYNANMKELAGPWDRSYGYSMSRYMSIMALWMWSFIGLEHSPLGASFKFQPWAIAHNDDYEIGPLIAILAASQIKLISDKALKSLSECRGEHFYETSAFSEAYDNTPRNMTTWLSENLTIGAESFDENVVGGPARNPLQFNPAVVQWARVDGSTGFFTLWPETKALQAEVSNGRLSLTYPYGNDTSAFVFHVSPNGLGGARDIASWDDVDGIDLKVSGSVDANSPLISFCGIVGGACDPVNEFDLWNFTYTMPPGSTETPRIVLDISATQPQASMGERLS